MTDRRKEQLLRRAALRASQYKSFVGRDLRAYRTTHGLSEDDLARWLGCDPARLARLALCRRPDASEAHFREQVERIARYSGAHAPHLAQLFREVDATLALQSRLPEGVPAEGSGLLLAARDRGEGEKEVWGESPQTNERPNGGREPDHAS